MQDIIILLNLFGYLFSFCLLEYQKNIKQSLNLSRLVPGTKKILKAQCEGAVLSHRCFKYLRTEIFTSFSIKKGCITN